MEWGKPNRNNDETIHKNPPEKDIHTSGNQTKDLYISTHGFARRLASLVDSVLALCVKATGVDAEVLDLIPIGANSFLSFFPLYCLVTVPIEISSCHVFVSSLHSCLTPVSCAIHGD